MNTQIGKKWAIRSSTDVRFNISGYTKPGDDYENDAIKAMEQLARYIGKSIPRDIELDLLSTDQ